MILYDPKLENKQRGEWGVAFIDGEYFLFSDDCIKHHIYRKNDEWWEWNARVSGYHGSTTYDKSNPWAIYLQIIDEHYNKQKLKELLI